MFESQRNSYKLPTVSDMLDAQVNDSASVLAASMSYLLGRLSFYSSGDPPASEQRRRHTVGEVVLSGEAERKRPSFVATSARRASSMFRLSLKPSSAIVKSETQK